MIIVVLILVQPCFRMPMMGPMGNMGGPPQMNMGMNPGSNQPQQNKPLFPSAATVCTHSFHIIFNIIKCMQMRKSLLLSS